MPKTIVRAWFQYPIMLATEDCSSFTQNYSDFDKMPKDSWWKDTEVTVRGNTLAISKPGFLTCVVPFKSYWERDEVVIKEVVAKPTSKGADAPKGK